MPALGSTFPAGGAQLTSPADTGTAIKRTGPTEAGAPMADDEVQSAMHLMVSDAIVYIDSELSPSRGIAADYYNGKPFGNEEDGRSQVVMTVVRDTVNMILPSLLRVFYGGERPCEYAPNTEAQIAVADQQTAYVCDVVIAEDNDGFLQYHSWFKDALVKQIGVMKWWWDESEETTTHHATRLQAEQILMLEDDPEVEITRVAASEDSDPGENAYDLEYKRNKPRGMLRLMSLPPEEFLVTRGARTASADAVNPGVALFVGHRTELTRSQLLAMGISEEDIEDYAFKDASLDSNVEEVARQKTVKPGTSEAGPEETRKALFIEGYPYLDLDGDGVAELCKVLMLGPAHNVISAEPWDMRRFAILCPDPEPHTAINGLSVADYTMDLQKIESMVVRSLLDSLSLAIHPRMSFVEGEVSVEDILNTEMGAPIRMRQPGMVQEIAHSFVGKEALPVLEYLSNVREERTGVTKASAGLSPEALQSATQSAVAASVSAAQQHIEMIARIFAETGVKTLMKGLLKDMCAHPDAARMVKLRGQYVTVDPREWVADLNVRVNVALGGGLDAEKIETLGLIKEEQKALLLSLGPTNPVAPLQNYVYTLRKILELKGRKDGDRFFSDPPPNWQPPPKPDPAQAQAQAEQMRAQADVQKSQADIQNDQQRLQIDEQRRAAEIQIRREEMHMTDERERDKLEAEMSMKKLDMDARIQMEREKAQIDANAKVAVERERMRFDAKRRSAERTLHVKKNPETGEMEVKITHAKEGMED